MFLTKDEVIELTGKKQRSAQAAVLNALGITYKVRPDGSLVILRSHVEQKLGIVPAKPVLDPRLTWEPNWDAFKEMEQERLRKREAQRAAKKEKTNLERKRKGLPPIE